MIGTPARQLHLFKGKRQRGVRPATPKEFALHCSVADLLRRWIMPGWKWTHFPAGEERPARINRQGERVSGAGARLKRMGLSSGWPDFQFFHLSGTVCFLELKRRGSGTLSDEQEDIAAHLIRAGHGYLCTDDFNDAVATLILWRILRGGIEVQ
jgi:hypothetical protein